MNPLVRVAAIVLGIAAMFVLLFLNKYVAQKYWLEATMEGDDSETADE